MDMILSFMLSILASVIAYYICKWLDRKLKVFFAQSGSAGTRKFYKKQDLLFDLDI